MKLSPEQKEKLIEDRARNWCGKCAKSCTKSPAPQCKGWVEVATSDVEWHEAHWPEIKLPEKYNGMMLESEYAQGYNQALEDVKKLNGMEGR